MNSFRLVVCGAAGVATRRRDNGAAASGFRAAALVTIRAKTQNAPKRPPARFLSLPHLAVAETGYTGLQTPCAARHGAEMDWHEILPHPIFAGSPFRALRPHQ